MVAIVGIPGSRFHAFKRFPDRKAAEQWAAETRARILRDNPALGSLPDDVISDREAARRRYRDGTRVYG